MKDNFDNLDSQNDEHLSEELLQEFQLKLLELKKQIENESLEVADALKNDAANEPDYYNRAISEVSTSITLRATNVNAKILNEIDIALKKIKNGEYGYCEITGEPINLNRLKAVPYTRFSIAAQEQLESRKNKFED